MTKKAIFIDAIEQDVKEVEWETLEDLQGYVEGFIEVAWRWPNNVLLVNEEGRLRNIPYGFKMEVDEKMGHIPFIGSGLVVGVDEEDFVSHKICLSGAKAMVQF
jgi:hypothetical protein